MLQSGLFPEACPDSGPALYATVAVALPVEGAFDYRVPSRLRDRVRPGVTVKVRFSGRQLAGICLGLSEKASCASPLDLLGIDEKAPILSENLIRLAQWLAEHYCCPLGEVLFSIIPRAARKDMGGRKVLVVHSLLGFEEAGEKAEELLEKQSKQARVLRILAEAGGQLTMVELVSKANVSRSPVLTLARHGWVRLQETTHTEPLPTEHPGDFPRPARLSREQDQALTRIMEVIDSGGEDDFLLYGVTGSGKTEIYLRAIEAGLAKGKGAIVLVPEISLTPQTIARFRGRFERVALLHSRLTDSERSLQWKRIQRGEADVVVGARSALFAPMPNLGLLIIDEEHETSFKQQNAPPYHARTVALKRGEIEGATVILGSATPSLESYALARHNQLKTLVLRNRVGGRTFPAVTMVDMRQEKNEQNGAFLSGPLEAALSHTLAQNKQAILFLNRRGYYPVLFCPTCEAAIRCEQCDISLTLHRQANRLICHYCGHEMLPPRICPTCERSKLRFVGAGTERVEDEVKFRFRGARVLRMDSDTMISRDAHEKAFHCFKSGQADILIGTQMIAKGLDFPEVTLVGVIMADTPLYQPDFRASERAYQLLAQVSGRAGRGDHPGRVIVQTYNPEHYSIAYAMRNDYPSFARKEYQLRKESGYPPCAWLLRVVFSGEILEEVERLASEVGRELANLGLGERTVTLGPAKAPITMINGRNRWHLLIKSPIREELARAAQGMGRFFRKRKRAFKGRARLSIDMEPFSML